MSIGKLQKEQIDEKALTAFRYRKNGKAYETIAELLNVSIRTAYTYTKRGRELYYEAYPDEKPHVMNFELARLDDMTDGIFEKARSGDCKAIEAMIRIMDRRSKFLGLDAPARQEIETKKSEVSAADLSDDELAAIIRAGQSST